MSTFKTAAVATLVVAVFAACKPADDASGTDQPGGDVVVAVGTSRSGEHTEHRVECAADPNAELGDYRVIVPAEVSYTIPEGAPCPAGPREPMPFDEHPELYAELSKAMNEPLPFEGGDLDTCGTWGTADPDEARLTGGHAPMFTDNDGFGAVWRDGIETGRFTFAEVDR